MSALEQTPFTVPATPPDRRVASRTRIAGVIAAHMSRRDAVLIDLSDRGAKVRHEFSVLRGSSVRLAFEWNGGRFATNAEVLASRVIALGDGNGGATIFESRLRFMEVDRDCELVLQRVIAEFADRDLRHWVNNMQGDNDAQKSEDMPKLRMSYVRLRFIRDRWWEKKWTHDSSQPEDGFVVPATFDAKDIEGLCETYGAGDEEGRQLIRTMAAEAVTASAQ